MSNLGYDQARYWIQKDRALEYFGFFCCYESHIYNYSKCPKFTLEKAPSGYYWLQIASCEVLLY